MGSNKSQSVIPAHAGFYILQIVPDENNYPVGATKEPIIGWQISDVASQPLPITASGCEFEELEILYPDGQVCNPNGESFTSFEDWLNAKQFDCDIKRGRSAENV